MSKFEHAVKDIVAYAEDLRHDPDYDFESPDLPAFRSAVWVDDMYFANSGLSREEFGEAIEQAWKQFNGANSS